MIDIGNGIAVAAHHQMDVASGYLADYSQVNAPSFGTAVPAEDWTAFMANVDEVLLAVDTRGFSYH